MTGRSEPTRPFVDAPITDVASATAAAVAAASAWGLDAPVLSRLGMNALFVSGSVVLRVSRPTVDARAALDVVATLSDAGVRVPSPASDDVFVEGELSVTSWHRIADRGDAIDWHRVGAMVRQVHDLDPAAFPGSVPMPRPEHFAWWQFDELLERAAAGLDEPARRGLVDAIERGRDWHATDDRVVCHGDVHPGNIMMADGGPVLIDWDLLCWGPPGWDHGPMMTWATRWGGDPGEYEAFAEGYGKSLRSDPRTETIAELRLVAATLMRVIAGLRDPAAMPEAQRRLAYWRGDPDAPDWTAQ